MAHPAQHSSSRPAGSTWSLPQLDRWLIVPLIVVLSTATVGRLLVYSPGVEAQESAVLQRIDALRPGALDALALVLHHVFSTPGTFAIVAALTVWLALRRRTPWDAAGFALTALCGWAAIALVKVAVGRPRPDATALADPLVVADGFTSFPSGHTGAALAVVVAFALAVRRSGRGPLVLGVGLGLAALVGLSRLHLGVHYPLDVLASLPVAWAGLAVGCGLANLLVPALAFGFGWQQQDVRWHDAAPAPGRESRAGSPRVAERAPAAERPEDRRAA